VSAIAGHVVPGATIGTVTRNWIKFVKLAKRFTRKKRVP